MAGWQPQDYEQRYQHMGQPQQWQPQQYPYQQQLPPVFPPDYTGQPNSQGYWPQPVQVNVTQNAYGPGRAYTRQGLGPFWSIFHLTMTCMTCGLWIPIWIWHARSRNSVTMYR